MRCKISLVIVLIALLSLFTSHVSCSETEEPCKCIDCEERPVDVCACSDCDEDTCRCGCGQVGCDCCPWLDFSNAPCCCGWGAPGCDYYYVPGRPNNCNPCSQRAFDLGL